MPPIAGQQRQREPPPLAQLAEVELAPRLEPDDEEEERHQAAVDPLAQVERDAGVAEVDRERRRPERVVRRRVDVHPDERGDRRGEQDRGAAGLRAQELAQRRLEAPRPRRPPGEARRLRVVGHRTVGLTAHGNKGTNRAGPEDPRARRDREEQCARSHVRQIRGRAGERGGVLRRLVGVRSLGEREARRRNAAARTRRPQRRTVHQPGRMGPSPMRSRRGRARPSSRSGWAGS